MDKHDDPLLNLMGEGQKKEEKKKGGGNPPPSRTIKKFQIPQHWLIVLDDNIKQYPKVLKSGRKRSKNKNFIIRQCLNDLAMTEEMFLKMVEDWNT